MGAMFSKPSMPEYNYSYGSYVPPVTTTTPPANTGTTPSTDNTDVDADRVAAIARRRTFPDTIQTSYRGVLQQGPWAPQRKSLLGE